MRQRAHFIVALAATLVVASCGDDDDATSTDTSTTVATTAPAFAEEVAAGAPFPASRCEANRAAGPITYLSGFDFAATASIIEVVIAEDRGYFDELCLDVELQPSFSTENYPIIAAGDAQFASGGSFSEVVNFAAANETDLVAVAVEGRSAIDALIVKPGEATRLEDLEGTTIGVKGRLAPSLAAMLASVGLAEGEGYETVLIDGFDPLVHIELPGIVGFTAYKSNEPGQLERAGVEFELFASSDYDIPGSFGVLYTTREFIDEHPTAVQDFLRASMRGLADALADPEGAAATAIELVEAGGNPNFLSPEGETFRWTTDVESITAETPEGTGVGVPDPALLQAEVDAYAEVGLFGEGGAPEITDRYDVDLVAGVYDDTGEVIWPEAGG
jgi:ABC-type nitrate/sulfonate/bicarbonate transport system substrate-binding protein